MSYAKTNISSFTIVFTASSTGFTAYYSGVSPANAGLTPELIGRRHGASILKAGIICQITAELLRCFSLCMVRRLAMRINGFV
jgi:hypothetical protein